MHAENILICIAIPLIIAVLFLKGSARRVIAFFIIGMGACLLAAYMGGYLEYALTLNVEDTSIFISPVSEEIMKFVPVLLYLLLLSPSDDELIHASIGVGAGFATFENVCHILSNGSWSIRYILIRGLATGVMHMICLITLSMAIVVLRKYQAITFPVIMGALGISVSFHALYNLLVSRAGVSSYIGYVIPVTVAAVISLLKEKILHKAST